MTAMADIPALEIWDVEAERQVLTLTGHQEIYVLLSISADGKQLLSSGCDGTVRQWQVFPWEESQYLGAREAELAPRIRNYADRYWQERLAAEAVVLSNTTPMRVVQLPFDRSSIPPRSPATSSRLLDLTDYYNSLLNRPFHLSADDNNQDDDLRNLPPGVKEYGGRLFDVRGVIQLHKFEPKGLFFELGWQDTPMRVDGIPIQQKARRLSVLHGSTGLEMDGTVIGTIVWHFADGQQSESEIIYGRHVRDWWVRRDSTGGPTPDARIGWEGTNPGATECTYYGPAEPGKELRLYTATWDNPRPEVEVTSLDLVSKDTESAPFFLGITVE